MSSPRVVLLPSIGAGLARGVHSGHLHLDGLALERVPVEEARGRRRRGGVLIDDGGVPFVLALLVLVDLDGVGPAPRPPCAGRDQRVRGERSMLSVLEVRSCTLLLLLFWKGRGGEGME